MLCEKKNKKKFGSANIGLAHFKILTFSDFSSMGVGLENDSQCVTFCHPLQVAFFCVKNSMHYLNIMAFESILDVFFVQDRYVSKN